MPYCSRSARVAVEPRGCAWQSLGALGLVKPPKFENVSILVSRRANTPAIPALPPLLRTSEGGSQTFLMRRQSADREPILLRGRLLNESGSSCGEH